MAEISSLENTKKMLELLNDDEISAVEGVTRAFIMNSPFSAKTEEELFQRIDKSIAQADAGEVEDADKAIDDIISELGL